VDKDADGRITEEEVKEVRVHHPIKNFTFYFYWIHRDTQILKEKTTIIDPATIEPNALWLQIKFLIFNVLECLFFLIGDLWRREHSCMIHFADYHLKRFS